MGKFLSMPRLRPPRRPASVGSAVSAATLHQLAQRLQHYRARLGQQGMAAILVVLAGLCLFPLSIDPSRAAIEEARLQLDKPVRTAPPSMAQQAQPAGMPQLQASLDSEDQFPDRIDRMLQYAAEVGLPLNDGAYTVARESRGHIVRYEVTLAMHGSYPQVRRFATAVVARERGVALLDLQLRRAKISEPALDAVIRLGYFMRPAP